MANRSGEDSFRKLPVITLPIQAYETSLPYHVDGDRKTFFTTFRWEGCDVMTGDDLKLGQINGAMGGGVFIRVGGSDNVREFYIPPDDLWYAVLDAIGVTHEQLEEAARTTERPVTREVREHVVQTKQRKAARQTEECTPKYFHKNPLGLSDELIQELDLTPEAIAARRRTPDPVAPPIIGEGWAPVDYNHTSLSHVPRGFHELPQPVTRMWPGSPDQRRVHVKIMNYPGYPHFFLDIDEEDNPVWDGRTVDNKVHGWVVYSDDPDRKGRTDQAFHDDHDGFPCSKGTHFHYDFYYQAIAMANYLLEKYFQGYRVDWDLLVDDHQIDGYDGSYFGKHGE